MLSFTEPWLFDYPISFGFDVYRSSHDREADVGWGYDEKRTGGDIRFVQQGKSQPEQIISVLVIDTAESIFAAMFKFPH